MLGGVALHAGHPSTASTRRIARAPYTADEVIEFVLLSRGRVVADHPALMKAVPAAGHPLPAAKVHAALETVSRCIDRIDASAGPALTAAVNAADPQRLDSALHRFDAAAAHWMVAPHTQDAPCPPPPPPPSTPSHNDSGGGWWHLKGFGFLNYIGIGNYVVLGDNFYVGYLTVGIAAVISAALFVAALVAVYVVLVPILLSYEFDNAPSDLDRQTAIAKIARALRS